MAKNVHKMVRDSDKRSMYGADTKEKVTHRSDKKIIYESDRKLAKK